MKTGECLFVNEDGEMMSMLESWDVNIVKTDQTYEEDAEDLCDITEFEEFENLFWEDMYTIAKKHNYGY